MGLRLGGGVIFSLNVIIIVPTAEDLRLTFLAIIIKDLSSVFIVKAIVIKRS